MKTSTKSVFRCYRPSFKLINDRVYSISHAGNGLFHPFFKLSAIEQFTLCFSERKTSLVKNSKIFPTFTDNLSTMKQTLQLNPINVSNKKDTIKWLEKYNKEVTDDPLNGKLKSFDTVIHKTIPTSFINKEEYPQLEEIIELFENRTLITNDPVTLNSLIDYFLLNNRSGIFAEDIYIFLLNEYSDSIDKLSLILGSVKLHVNNKLDYFPDIENIISRILTSINKLPNSSRIKSFDNSFQDLLQKISSKFNLEDTLSLFNDTVILQMLQYHLFKTQNLIECKILLSLLLSIRHIRPPNEFIYQYLMLLDEKTQVLNFDVSKLQKLIFISDFRNLIEKYPTIQLIQFIIPLCTSFTELRNIMDIILGQDNRLQYFETLSDRIIKQYDIVTLRDKSILGTVEIVNLYNGFNVTYNGAIPLDIMSKILMLMISNGNYAMTATILSQNKQLKEDSKFLKQLVSRFPSTNSIEKQKFIKLFNIKANLK